MPSLLNAAIILGVLAIGTRATTYAQFCNDYNCEVGCGESVSVDNPGCLGESGRGSVKFHGINAQPVALLWSPGNNCNCQENCFDDIVKAIQAPTTPCLSLEGSPAANSFRFIGGTCPSNNC